MNIILLRILAILAGIGSIAIGAYMCLEGNDNWGWFLLVGFLLSAAATDHIVKPYERGK